MTHENFNRNLRLNKILLLVLLSLLALGNGEGGTNLDTIKRNLTSGTTEERREALINLQSLPKPPEEFIPLLIQNVKYPSNKVKGAAILMLKAYGRQAKDAVPVLLEEFPKIKEKVYFKLEIVKTVGIIGIDLDETKPWLLSIVQDENEDSAVKFFAIKGLGKIGKKSPDIIEVLSNLLDNDKEEKLKWIALDSLARIDPKNLKYIAQLEKAADPRKGQEVKTQYLMYGVSQTTYRPHRMALRTLVYLGYTQKVTEICIRFIESRDPSKMSLAVNLAHHMGEKASDTVPFLLDVLTEEDSGGEMMRIKHQILYLLMTIEPMSERVISAFEQLNEKTKNKGIKSILNRYLKKYYQYRKNNP